AQRCALGARRHGPGAAGGGVDPGSLGHASRCGGVGPERAGTVVADSDEPLVGLVAGLADRIIHAALQLADVDRIVALHAIGHVRHLALAALGADRDFADRIAAACIDIDAVVTGLRADRSRCTRTERNAALVAADRTIADRDGIGCR